MGAISFLPSITSEMGRVCNNCMVEEEKDLGASTTSKLKSDHHYVIPALIPGAVALEASVQVTAKGFVRSINREPHPSSPDLLKADF